MSQQSKTEQILLDHYERSYYLELERKDAITSGLNLQITIGALSVGALAFFLNNMPTISLSIYPLTFTALLLISIWFVAIAIYLIFRALTGYYYEYVSKTTEIDTYAQDLSRYNSEVAQKERIDVGEKLRSVFLKQYCKCAAINAENNITKSGYLHKATMSLLAAVALIAATAVPFYLIKYNLPEKTHKVQIISSEVQMSSEEDEDSGSTTKSDDQPSKTPEPPAEPETKSVEESKKDTGTNLESED